MFSLARFFALLFIVSGLLFLSPDSVYAQGEFQTDYKVTYNAEPSGRTNVIQEITLKNKKHK